MIRGTTPTHTFTLPFSTGDVKKARIIYAQNDKVIFVKEQDDCKMDGNDITVKLKQEETFLFDANYPVEIQVRVMTNDDTVLVSGIIRVSADRCLDTEVMA